MATKLISITNFSDFKSITLNIDAVKKLDPYILEAQEFDLRPLLGGELYIDLLAAFTANFTPLATHQKMKDLYDGKEYTIGTRKFIHEGIKPILVYFSYSRYLSNANVSSTAFGLVQKTTPDSQPIPEKTIGRLMAQARAGAEAYWSRTYRFLIDKIADYPQYRCPTRANAGGIKLVPVGGNSKADNRYGYRRCDKCGNYLYDCYCCNNF